MKTRTPTGWVTQSAAKIALPSPIRTFQVIVGSLATAVAIRDLIRGILSQQTPRFDFEWRMWHDEVETDGGYVVYLELPAARYEVVHQDLAKDLEALAGLVYVLA